MKGGLGRFMSWPFSRNALNFSDLLQKCHQSRLSRRSKFCTCPRYMAMRVSLCPVPVAELCLSVSLFCRIFSLCHFRGCLRSYVLMRRQRFRTFDFQCEFRPS